METLEAMSLQTIHSRELLTALVCLLLCWSASSLPLLQGNEFPCMTSEVKEVSGKSFDYIIVGGGTTGCPLAATLSESFSVLLVERGGSPYGNPLVIDKRYYGFSLLQTDEFSSVAQSFISKDGVRNHRGRVLGGSSAINGGFYSRASEDFVKRTGWDEKLVDEAYRWLESRVVFIPELTEWQTVVEFGLLEAGILPYNGFSLEHIEGTKVGASVFDQFGKRHTSADLLAAGNPKNITVLLNATVKNIIFNTNGKGNGSRACGIRFIKSDGSSNKIHEAYLNRPNNNSGPWGDVIVSAGALGSPQLLLLSGIGPREHLKDFNIPLVVDLEEVGHGMQDNPCIAQLVDTVPEKRLPEPPLVVGIADDFRFIIQGGVLPISFNASRMPIAAKMAFPASKGKLELKSEDPRQNPSVEFNYLAKEKDLEECVKMVKLLEKVANSQSVSLFLGIKPQEKLMSSTDELRKLCKNNVRTFYHYHGGCAVGSVIDNDYRVYGVKGLRVIDGSTFQESPGTNPMATLMMLGRYQGIKILKERRATSASCNQQNP